MGSVGWDSKAAGENYCTCRLHLLPSTEIRYILPPNLTSPDFAEVSVTAVTWVSMERSICHNSRIVMVLHWHERCTVDWKASSFVGDRGVTLDSIFIITDWLMHTSSTTDELPWLVEIILIIPLMRTAIDTWNSSEASHYVYNNCLPPTCPAMSSWNTCTAIAWWNHSNPSPYVYGNSLLK